MCESKVCRKCGIDKSLDDYYKANEMRDKHASMCKSCTEIQRKDKASKLDLSLITITTKICTKCKIEKELNLFYKSKYSKDGYKSICKVCCRLSDEVHIINFNSDLVTVTEKICTTCGVNKPLDEYYVAKRADDGRQSCCIACVKQYRKNNKERIAALNAKYYAEHKDELFIKHQQWLKDNPEMQKKYNSKRKGFGHISINKHFTWCEAHHLHLEDNHEFIINIPCFLHRLYSHNSFSWKNMDTMNAIALDFLINENSIYKDLYEL